jgi:1-acyl-sn-glycerol-3-phosphate acyltransferase
VQKVSRPAVIAATVWFWLVFAATAPACVIIGVLLRVATAPFDPDRRALHAFICRWCWPFLRVSPGWHARVKGRELLPQGPCVIVANHQSMADVVAAMGLFHPFKFVSKASLFSLPLVGWMMRWADYVAIDRGRHGSMKAMMDRCRFWLGRGIPVLIFPEGTYSSGGPLLPFKRGAFLLAMEEQVPLVPVALRGTSALVHEDGPWMNPRSDIEVEVLAPLMPAEFGADPRALSLRVRSLLARAVGREDSEELDDGDVQGQGE